MRNNTNPLGVYVHRTPPLEKALEQCHVITMPDSKISDALAHELGEWEPLIPTLISAPTGAGKTYFLRTVVRYCQRVFRGRKVLLLVNRTAIATQQKAELARALGSAWGKTNDLSALSLVDEFEDIGLSIMTYQKFASQHHQMNLQEFAFAVCDEVHFFHADALFNSSLDQLFWRLPGLFDCARRIYMTATPDSVLPDIVKAEKHNLTHHAIMSWAAPNAGKMRIYSFPRHPEKVELSYFRKVDEIVGLVRKHPKDQFLIFTATREDRDRSAARSYKRALEDAGISVEYIDSRTKGGEAWNQICSTGTFNAQVLLCTSVLDCGVSLHSTKLRHVVVESTDQTEFLQMIGRRRLNTNEVIKIYVKVPTKSDLFHRLEQIRKHLDIIREGFSAAKTKRFDPLIYRVFAEDGSNQPYRHLLNYEGDGRIFPKLTAYHHLTTQRDTLLDLLKEMDQLGDDSALPRLAHKWLEQPDGYSHTRWLDYDHKATIKQELLEYLEGTEDGIITAKQWPGFAERVQQLTSQLHKFAKNERTIQERALNTRFKKIGIPWSIEKNGRDYALVRTEDDDS